MDPQTTLRDTLAANLAEAGEVEAPESVVEPSVAPEGETAEQREARERDERGRFVAKPGEAQQQVQAPAVERPPRPSSWKKDYWDHWDKLDPALASYLHQREREYATGVSTYKAEADRAKSIQEALTPFTPILQQSGIEPAQWIQQLGRVHYVLAYGKPEEKAAVVQNLIRDFGVQLDSAPQTNEEVQALRQQLQQLQGGLQQVHSTIEQQQNAAALDEISRFSQGKPYFEDVRQTMAGLLQSGMAQNLQEAYDKAIRLNDDVWTRHQAETQRQTQAQAHVAKAKAAAVSVRTSAPGGAAQSAGSKGLRDTLSEALESYSGRV